MPFTNSFVLTSISVVKSCCKLSNPTSSTFVAFNLVLEIVLTFSPIVSIAAGNRALKCLVDNVSERQR